MVGNQPRTARCLAGEWKDPAQRNGLCHFPHHLGGPCLSRLDQRRAASVPDYAVLGCRRSLAQRNASPTRQRQHRAGAGWLCPGDRGRPDARRRSWLVSYPLDFVKPLVEALRPIPPIAWTPLAILWFGVGDAPSYFLVFIGAVFPVFVSTYSAVRNIERTQINAALCLGATPGMLIWDVLIPGALPVIFPGLRIALGVGWMCVVAAELIAAHSGLGYMIQQSRLLLQTQFVVTGMIVIGIIGFAMNAVMTAIERRLVPWQESSKAT